MSLCHGNLYATTLHVINSAIVKLSKLSYAHKVYRGIRDRGLPDAFWKANESGVKGGIETAFMSTTLDRKIAMQYAGDGKIGIIFEIQQGMIDRGADLSWISQYPHEREITFTPLTGLEVQSTRVEGRVLVVGVRVGWSMVRGRKSGSCGGVWVVVNSYGCLGVVGWQFAVGCVRGSSSVASSNRRFVFVGNSMFGNVWKCRF